MAIYTTNTSLSANDARILNALFDPETLPSSVAASKSASIIDALLPPHPTISSSDLSTLEIQQTDLIRHITPNSTPSSIQAAICEEDAIILRNASYPSAYLNRAMLRRLNIETSSASLPDKASLFTAWPSDLDAVFSDISDAIEAALPSPSSSASSAVSPYQARMLRTAYAHRAYLYLKATEAGVELHGMGKSELEELASADFAAAARFGDEVAREMSVRTNPYAKMCGAIVRNALAEERKEMLG